MWRTQVSGLCPKMHNCTHDVHKKGTMVAIMAFQQEGKKTGGWEEWHETQKQWPLPGFQTTASQNTSFFPERRECPTIPNHYTQKCPQWCEFTRLDQPEATLKMWMSCGQICGNKSVGYCMSRSVFSWNSYSGKSGFAQPHQYLRPSNNCSLMEINLKNTQPRKRHSQKSMHPANCQLLLK